MKLSRIIIAFSLITILSLPTDAQIQAPASDSLTLAQAFINLSLTQQYFDTLRNDRVAKIIPYEENELGTIVDSGFIKTNNSVFNLSLSLLNLNHIKFLFRTKTEVERDKLLTWKKHLDKSIQTFNNASLSSYFNLSNDPSDQGNERRSFNEFIGLSDTLGENIKTDIRRIRGLITPFFNENIYPDFQRIFYQVKETEKFNFDSLTFYTSSFNLPLSRYILDNQEAGRKRISMENRAGNFTLNQFYTTDQKLELISKYLQLYYLAGKENTLKLTMKDRFTLHDHYLKFNEELTQFYKNNLADSFFNREINAATSKKLYEKLSKKYPLSLDGMGNPKHMAMPSMMGNERPPGKYYFPIPAPRPSAALYVNNFKPGLSTYKQVDNYLVNIFNGGGYNGRMHYYYVKSGFAVTTNLEKINTDGSPASGAQRWNVSVSGNGSFSMYQVFKSIFFDTESNFRIFALVVSPNKATVQSSASSLAAMSELIQYSYPSLPADLNDVVPPTKTLSILVYQYKQSDVGEVPVLEIKKPITLLKHLSNSGLGALLNP